VNNILKKKDNEAFNYYNLWAITPKHRKDKED